MSISGQSTQQKFPFDYDKVFDGLCEIMPTIGFSIKNADKVIGRITAKSGMSLFSWGENLALSVEKLDQSSTLVAIESSLKVGFNVAGAGRHAKNFEKIIHALSMHLRTENNG